MTGGRARKALQVFVAVLGTVAVLAGLSTVLLGADSIIGAEEVSGAVDGEMRFFAVWYVAAGVVLLRTLPKVETQGRTIATIAGLFFVAGCTRVLSWLVVGRPHTAAIVLMAIELSLPFILVPWQAAISTDRGGSARLT